MPSLTSIRRAIAAFLVRRQNRVDAAVSLDELTRQHLDLARLTQSALSLAQATAKRLEHHEQGPLGPSALALEDANMRGIVQPRGTKPRIVLLGDDDRSH